MRRIAPEIYGGAFRNDPSLLDSHAAAMRGARHMGYLYQLLAMTGWTSLPWLWSLRQPTLVLMGSDDPLVPVINGHILASLIPNAQLRTIADGHLFMVTRPAETAASSRSFWPAKAPVRSQNPMRLRERLATLGVYFRHGSAQPLGLRAINRKGTYYARYHLLH
jgi:hypothetical protein